MRYPEFYYRWEWQLRSTPEQLWPLVADTNRFNRDTGLPAVHHTDGETRGNARQSLRFSWFGVRVEWEEEPFEWVRPYRFGVHRRYRAGPVASTRVLVELTPLPDGGTRLLYQTWVRPNNLLGMIAVPPLMKFSNRRAFDAAFRRYDELRTEAGLAFVQLRQAHLGTSPLGGVIGWLRCDGNWSSRPVSLSLSHGLSSWWIRETTSSWRGYSLTRSPTRGECHAGKC